MKQEKQMIESCRNWLLQHGEILNIKHVFPTAIVSEQLGNYWQIDYKLYLGYSLYNIMHTISHISEFACWLKLCESVQEYIKENEIHIEIISERVVQVSVVPKQKEEYS